MTLGAGDAASRADIAVATTCAGNKSRGSFLVHWSSLNVPDRPVVVNDVGKQWWR